MCFRIFFIILSITTISTDKPSSPYNWKAVELLIEENPYVVALLNTSLDYICTGTIISKKSVLTSGTCVTKIPKLVAVGLAVVGKTRKSSMFDVASTRLHGDYEYEFVPATQNITRLHSNIGIVFVVRPMLELFIKSADIGNYYALELQDVGLTTMGYGQISGSHAMVLQYMEYETEPCANPKWYYCICGVDETKARAPKTYVSAFGNGGPVLLENEVVGVTASASGELYLNDTHKKYNIFTVIAPYVTWIHNDAIRTKILKMRAISATSSVAVRVHFHEVVKFVFVLLLLDL